MKKLSLAQLHALRLKIFENAQALHREAGVLLSHGMHARAYLLAHFCFEELGKIPIIISVVHSRMRGEEPEWSDILKAFRSHEQKIGMENGHHYAFGPRSGDTGLEWLLAANATVKASYERKNTSTYVDVRGDALLAPNEQIARTDAMAMVELAAECLQAHRRSEELTNPILYAREERTNPAE